MKPLLSLRVVAIALLIGASFTSFGCRKKKDTIAKVYVIDGTTNQPVTDCNVKLYIKEPTEDGKAPRVVEFEMTAMTNSSGEASFILNDTYQLGQAGVVVADILATKNGASTEGIIKIDEEKTSEETVFF